MRLGRLLLSGPLQVAAAGLATRAAPQLATAADHERVRAASHAATVVVRAAEDASSDADAPRTFTVSNWEVTDTCCFTAWQPLRACCR